MDEDPADYELLKLAAKAVGFTVAFWPHGIYADSGSSMFRWNPLADDGDALRLAVKLRLRVDAGYCGCADVYGLMVQATEAAGSDLGAATRRAIVRAAAALAP